MDLQLRLAWLLPNGVTCAAATDGRAFNMTPIVQQHEHLFLELEPDLLAEYENRLLL
jgi:hypothetical protein